MSQGPSPALSRKQLCSLQPGRGLLPTCAVSSEDSHGQVHGQSGTERHSGSMSMVRPWWIWAPCPQKLHKWGEGGGGHPPHPFPDWIPGPVAQGPDSPFPAALRTPSVRGSGVLAQLSQLRQTVLVVVTSALGKVT